LPPRQRHVHVVLIRSAPDREQDAPRRAHLDHLPPEFRHRAERRAPEAEEPVALLHPDARRRAPRAHPAHDQALVVGHGLETEELPGELVGARDAASRGSAPDALAEAVAPYSDAG